MTLISAKVKPNSREASVEKLSPTEFTIRVKAEAREGKANSEVLELLSEYFKRPRADFRMIRGHKSRNKLISVED